MTDLPTTLEERALASARAAHGDFENGFSETLGPVTFSARAMSGESPFHWGSTLFAVRQIDAPVTASAPTSVELWKRNGRLILTLLDVQPFAFYVEIEAQLSDPAMRIRWDAMMSDAGPVNGRATRDPHTGIWFFATAHAARQGEVYVTVDAMIEDAGPDDGVLILHRVTLLGFR